MRAVCEHVPTDRVQRWIGCCGQPSFTLPGELCGEGVLIAWGFPPPDQMDPTGTLSELALLEGSQGGRGTENGAWGLEERLCYLEACVP